MPRYFKVLHPFPGCDCRPGDYLRLEGEKVKRVRTLTLPASKLLRYLGEGHIREISPTVESAPDPTPQPETAAPPRERRRLPRPPHLKLA